MTMKLAEFQSAMQRAILERDTSILSQIPDGAKAKRDVLLDVYLDAYRLRLAGILRHDFPRTATLIDRRLGDGAFDALASDYIAANPSHTPNARWYGQSLPRFMASDPRLADRFDIHELAQLEGALNDVFDMPDVPAIGLDALAASAPGDFGGFVFAPHPTVRRLETHTDIMRLWRELDAKDDAPAYPEPAAACQEGSALLVWRQDFTARFRALEAEEAMAWDEAAKGVRFGVLCEMLAVSGSAETADRRAAQYIGRWLSDGLLCGVRTA